MAETMYAACTRFAVMRRPSEDTSDGGAMPAGTRSTANKAQSWWRLSPSGTSGACDR
jgi:hypothetical protein